MLFFSFQSKCNKFGAIPTLNNQERNVSGKQEDRRPSGAGYDRASDSPRW